MVVCTAFPTLLLSEDPGYRETFWRSSSFFRGGEQDVILFRAIQVLRKHSAIYC